VMLVTLFRDETIANSLFFRGGTALHKLYLDHPLRYSEDIDLVQPEAAPIGPQFDRIRMILRDRLGKPQRKIGPDVATLTYRLESEDSPPLPLRVKVEINTREHMQVLPVEHKSLDVQCRWFEGGANVPVYHLDELLATKLRALYQRRKGRDLFDLALALRSLPVDAVRLCRVFQHYMKGKGHRITAAGFRANLIAKLDHPGFIGDCDPLIRPGTASDPHKDFELIDHTLLTVLDDV
ncbi:nucleotidyl transferase AbiEii/AbiGii toxin family protein, partial [Candidatus Bipolaricaulota bacterium]|nr:nucleotidyl transferase AbiEii/AbiGii toxin family protein [Candidatus Bipolaricaulota bacterium]